MPEESTSQWFFRWLGRQVGHVKTAVTHDPANPDAPKLEGAASPAQSAKPQAAESAKPQAPQKETQSKKDAPPKDVVYRTDQVEEVPHPTDPNLKLRRTVIDEVIVEKKKES